MSEPPESQVDRLAKFIMAEVPGEPSMDEGAIDTAIRLIRGSLKSRPRPVRPGWVPPAGKALENKCSACGSDLSDYCFGALIPQAVLQGDSALAGRQMAGVVISTGLLLIQPLRCPFCKTPMFYQESQRVLRPLS
jgi:hypothetical protein